MREPDADQCLGKEAGKEEVIIETRFRDIPWEDVSKCSRQPTEASRAWWEKRRGTAVKIITPSSSVIDRSQWACDGPVYTVVNDVTYDKSHYGVCPHIALIGD